MSHIISAIELEYTPKPNNTSIVRVPNDVVAVQPLYDSDYYSKDSKIIRPDSAKERCDQGIVKYIGRNVPPEIKCGDHIFFKGYTGTMVELEGDGILLFLPFQYIDFKLENVPNTEIHGLYFYDPTDKEYYQVTYEMAIVLIRDAVVNSPWIAGIKHKAAPARDYKDIERDRSKVWG